MHLISVLASGVRGAESGVARIYQRGKSAKATWYSDAEATGVGSTADITLDENGGAIAYVGEYVTVVVSDSAGSTVRTFTQMGSDSVVEVRSPSFTGTDYSSGASAAGKPSDLNSVLDKWSASGGSTAAGASSTDFKVVHEDTVKTLYSAMGPTWELAINVKDPVYGAKGDGSTDDYAAIASAASAAILSARALYFPPGDYVLGTSLAISVPMIGHGPSLTTLTSTVTSGAAFTHFAVADQVPIQGLEFRNTGNSTGVLMSASSAVRWQFRDCLFTGGTGNGLFQFSGSQAYDIGFFNCRFDPNSSNSDGLRALDNTGRIVMSECTWTTPPSYTPTNGLIYGTGIYITGGQVELGATTTGTLSIYKATASKVRGACHGMSITASGGAAVTGFELGSLTTDSIFDESGNAVPDYSDSTFTLYTYSISAQPYKVNLLTRESRTDVMSASTSITLDAVNFMRHSISGAGVTGPAVSMPAALIANSPVFIEIVGTTGTPALASVNVSGVGTTSHNLNGGERSLYWGFGGASWIAAEAIS